MLVSLEVSIEVKSAAYTAARSQSGHPLVQGPTGSQFQAGSVGPQGTTANSAATGQSESGLLASTLQRAGILRRACAHIMKRPRVCRADQASAVSVAGPGGAQTQTSSDGSGFGAQTTG